jgi:hypothetical protein
VELSPTWLRAATGGGLGGKGARTRGQHRQAQRQVRQPAAASWPGAVPEGEGWIGVEPVLAGEVIATVLGYGTPK